MRGQQKMDFFIGGRATMDNGLVFWPEAMV